MTVLALVAGVVAAAGPCEAPVATYVEAVRARGELDAYLCLAELDAAGSELQSAIAAAASEPPPAPAPVEGPVVDASASVERARADRERAALSRALAIHLAVRLDRALTAEEVRALHPADRRLLRDAVHARRGRRTPAPDHEKVFLQLGWYRPDESYTNARLTALDRDNIALIDDPPPPPEPPGPEPAMAALAEVPGAEAGEDGCACSAGGRGPAGFSALGAMAAGSRRRKGRPGPR